MPGKPDPAGHGSKDRSAEQQKGSAAMSQVMQAWGELTDMEYLTWRTAGTSRRTHGITLFKKVNLRRLRRGQPLLQMPPPSRTFNPLPVLKRLVIRNQGGRLTFRLELRRRPTEPMTLWGARPCSRGLANPHKCPRLGWLRARTGLVCDITRLYFSKHAEYLLKAQLPIVGKRIFIRARRELDDGALLYEQVSAVVPPPEGAGLKKA